MAQFSNDFGIPQTFYFNDEIFDILPFENTTLQTNGSNFIPIDNFQLKNEILIIKLD